MGETERGELESRVYVTFYCQKGHAASHAFAHDAEIPELWDCPKCGLPSGQDERNPPPAPVIEPYKTHLAYVKERRSDVDGDAILAEALERMHDQG